MVDAVDAAITITANTAGVSFNRTVTFVSTVDEGAGAVTVTDNGTTLAISVDDDTNVELTDIRDAIIAELGTTDFTTTLADNAGDGQFNTTVDTDPALTAVGAATAGADVSGGLAASLVIELAGLGSSELRLWHDYCRIGNWHQSG